MRSNWSVVEHLRTDAAVPSEVDAWRLVHAVVSVQEGKKVHVAFFWQRRWVEAHGLTVGESVLLRLPKDHLCGEGSLTAIEPAPFVPGRGEPQGMLIVAGKQGGEGRGTVDTMEVGDYVTTYTHEERGDRSAIDDTQGEWVARQRIRLHLDKEDGGHSSLVLLRESEWVAAEKVVPGGTVFLNMPEMGTVGHATVEGVEPCLVFRRRGNSSIRMVTGTFRHSESRIGDLKLRGEMEPLGVTPKHPMWSVERRDWVPAGELVPGETVKTVKGTTTVESYVLCAKSEPVYNLEVDGDHCYRVGEQGILVHNASVPCAERTTYRYDPVTFVFDPSMSRQTRRTNQFENVPRSQKVSAVIKEIVEKRWRSPFGHIPWWDSFMDTNKDVNSWVKGHILAAEFGGLGGNHTENLVPITDLINNSGFGTCEDAIEKALMCGQVCFEGTVEYVNDLSDTTNPLRPKTVRLRVEGANGFEFDVTFTVKSGWNDIKEQSKKCSEAAEKIRPHLPK